MSRHAAASATGMSLLLILSVLGLGAVQGAALVQAVEAVAHGGQGALDAGLAYGGRAVADVQAKAAVAAALLAAASAGLAGDAGGAMHAATLHLAELLATVDGLVAIQPESLWLQPTVLVERFLHAFIFLKSELEAIAIAALNALVQVATSMIGNVHLELDVSEALRRLAAAAHEGAALGSGFGADAVAWGSQVLPAAGLLAGSAAEGDLDRGFRVLVAHLGALAGPLDALVLLGLSASVGGLDGALRSLVGPAVNAMSLLDAAAVGTAALLAVLALLAGVALDLAHDVEHLADVLAEGLGDDLGDDHAHDGQA